MVLAFHSCSWKRSEAPAQWVVVPPTALTIQAGRPEKSLATRQSPEVERADAPRSFTAIARDPVYTPTSLRVFFSTPHVQMPDFIFTRDQQDDLIAYLMQMREELDAQ